MEILGLLVDFEKKVYDEWKSDEYGLSSTRRAQRLSTVCRHFRIVLLEMPGAWAVVKAGCSGLAFLNMCSERSKDKGLRVYVNEAWPSPALGLLRNLVSDHFCGAISGVSVELRVGEDDPYTSYFRPSFLHDVQIQVVQLLGKLDNSSLKSLHVYYADVFTFRPTRTGVQQEVGFPDNVANDGSDGHRGACA